MKVKTLMTAAALFTGALLTSPYWAAETLSNEQLDTVTAGRGLFELGNFQTTILDIANPNYLDTYNVLNPNFSWGSDTTSNLWAGLSSLTSHHHTASRRA